MKTYNLFICRKDVDYAKKEGNFWYSVYGDGSPLDNGYGYCTVELLASRQDLDGEWVEGVRIDEEEAKNYFDFVGYGEWLNMTQEQRGAVADEYEDKGQDYMRGWDEEYAQYLNDCEKEGVCPDCGEDISTDHYYDSDSNNHMSESSCGC
jgi:hypothetical protein